MSPEQQARVIGMIVGAIPMAAIFSGWIAMSGSAKPKKRVATAPRIRTPIDVPEI